MAIVCVMVSSQALVRSEKKTVSAKKYETAVRKARVENLTGRGGEGEGG